MTTLIVEDDETQLKGFEAILKANYPSMNCLKAQHYDCAIDIINNNDIDLFLLDIELDKNNEQKNGIAIGEHLRTLPQHKLTPILYLTAMAQEAPRTIHATNCYDYLVKPFDLSELIVSIDKLLHTVFQTDSFLELKDRNGVFTRIQPEKIYYIHSERRNMHIYTPQLTCTTGAYKLCNLLDMLPDYFIQCHKSYIINSKVVCSYDKVNAYIRLNGDVCPTIPVGRNYKEQLERTLIYEHICF